MSAFVKVMTASALLSSLGMVTSGVSPFDLQATRDHHSANNRNQPIVLVKDLPFRIRTDTLSNIQSKQKDDESTYYKKISREKAKLLNNEHGLSQHVASRFLSEPLLQGSKGSKRNKQQTVTIASIEQDTKKEIRPTFTHPVTDPMYTSTFGMRGGRHHNGLDIVSTSHNLEIRAAKTGVVVYSQNHTSGLGNLIILDHGNGLETYYAHLSSRYVKEGDVVRAGDIIGKMGSTGHSTGVHLHFEVRKNNEPVNPLIYLKSS